MLAGQHSTALSAGVQASSQDTVTSANNWAPQMTGLPHRVDALGGTRASVPVTSAQPGASTPSGSSRQFILPNPHPVLQVADRLQQE